MRVRQQDIAKLAQVSQATVSRVLSGDERVESEIRDRVLAVMKERNYKPDVRARSLRQRRTNLIGLVLRRDVGTLQGDPFFAALVSEIIDCLVGTPYHLCVDIATDRARQKHVYDELLRTRRVDGLILVESEPSDYRIAQLQEDSFPFVVIGNATDRPELHCVDNDNVHAGRIATQHLIDGGYRKIAMIGGPPELTVTRDRVQGYCQACEAAGLPTEVVHSEFGQDAARVAASRLFERNDRPDAVLALDDYMAMGVFQAARTYQIRIPSDLGVVGFNDSALCEIVDGGLTSVNLRIDKMVRWSIRRLLDVIEERPLETERQKMMPCDLFIRGSSTRQKVATIL